MLVWAALFCALIALLSQIFLTLPSGIPLTLQTFAIALCGYTLRPKWSLGCVAAYLLLGVCGVPVFSALRGGFEVLAGVTGGYLWGFIPFVLLCSLGMQRQHTSARLGMGVAGLLCCHSCGVAQFAVVSGNSLLQAILIDSVIYLIKDIASVVLACFFAVRLRRMLAANPQ